MYKSAETWNHNSHSRNQSWRFTWATRKYCSVLQGEDSSFECSNMTQGATRNYTQMEDCINQQYTLNVLFCVLMFAKWVISCIWWCCGLFAGSFFSCIVWLSLAPDSHCFLRQEKRSLKGSATRICQCPNVQRCVGIFNDIFESPSEAFSSFGKDLKLCSRRLCSR